MSGYMDYDRVVRLYPKIVAQAEKANRILEIVFHPGQMLSEELSEEIDDQAAKHFYLCEDRHVEMKAVGLMKPLQLRHFVP